MATSIFILQLNLIQTKDIFFMLYHKWLLHNSLLLLSNTDVNISRKHKKAIVMKNEMYLSTNKEMFYVFC